MRDLLIFILCAILAGLLVVKCDNAYGGSSPYIKDYTKNQCEPRYYYITVDGRQLQCYVWPSCRVTCQ